jgi:hypothetical protein
MSFGERPTPFQALGRTLAILVGVATTGLWLLLAFGWDLGSLSRAMASH